MKTIILLSSILVVLISANYISGSFLARSALELRRELDMLTNRVETGSWRDALGSLESFESTWDKTKGIWAVLVEHREMDSIENSFKKIKAYLESENRPLALGEVETVKRLLEHIPEKTSFSLENIF